jgi:nucleolar protein 9
VLTSPAVAPKYRRKLFLSFMGKYDKLASDRLGSRVADTVWAAADGFIKEKIARSLIPHATTLGNDKYGRFVIRKMDVHLLQRRPDEWRQNMLGLQHHFAHQKQQQAPAAAAPATAPATEAEKTDDAEETKEERKRRKKEKRAREHDAIDDVFAEAKKRRA